MSYEEITAIADHLKEKLKELSIAPDVGIICGSGLGGLGENLDEDRPKVAFPYHEIPNFPKTTGQLLDLSVIRHSRFISSTEVSSAFNAEF